MSDLAKQEDDFEYWLANMDDYLEGFFASLPFELSRKLDSSPESLKHLETFILEQYNSVDEIMTADESKNLNGLSIYIGETFRKNLGGKWQIQLDDEKAANFGVPSLFGIGSKKRTDAPIYLVTLSISRRRGTLIYDKFLRRSE